MLVMACSAAPAATEVALPSATAPATLTATIPPTEAPPTLTPSATPIPKFFTEEFDNGFANWSHFLISGDENKLDLHTNNGTLVFDLSGVELWSYLTYDAQTYDNVRVDAQVENQGVNDNNISLLCRYDKDGGWYEFNVANSGIYDILYGKSTAAKKESYTLLFEGGSNNIKQGQAVNNYAIVCKDSSLSLYINDVLTRTIQETKFGLRQGKIAISVSSFRYVPVKIAFDWVKISEP
jgi:hypothetical protein